MTPQAFVGAAILSDGDWHNDHALVVTGDTIDAIVPAAQIPSGAERIDLAGGYLLPGFVDTQVNGGGGVLFNDVPTCEGVRAIAQTHRKFGTTGILPTLISDDLSVIAQAIDAVDEAIASGVPGVIGIHIEGPFLNAQKRGIHDSAKFRQIDAAAINLLASATRGKTLVTLAPETASTGTIAELKRRGIVVAAGHSMASYEQMAAAVSEGLTGLTHLFNAMTPLVGREPGMVGAAFDMHLFSGIIVDGHHVHPAALRAAFRAKGSYELMLVTDAMPSVDDPRSGFTLGSTWIGVKDGVLRGPDGTLAGSNLNMAHALRNAIDMMHVDIATASRMASGTPAAFLGLGHSHGVLKPGYRADLVHLDDALQPLATWIGGQPG